jgi:hypothetical protein
MKPPIDIYQYSQAQYQLGGPAKDPYPTRAREAAHKVIRATRSEQPVIVVPPYSMTIVRGNLSRASGK